MESRRHWHNHTPNQHLMHMERVRWDIGQMLTPPKSKSPWEAMTSGSTGGWASFAGPTNPQNPNDPKGQGWVGPLGTALAGLGLGPLGTAFAGLGLGLGPFISAGMGAAGSMGSKSGFQGTDKGWGNLGSTALGALGGWGAGSLTQGLASGIQAGLGGMPAGASSTWTAGQTAANSGTWGQGMLGNFGSGFGQGMANYGAATAAPFKQAGMNISKALGGTSSTAQPAAASNMLSGASSTWTPGQTAANAGTYGASATATGNAMLGAQGANVTASKNWGQSMLDFLTPQNTAGIALMGASALPKNATYSSPAMLGEMTAKLLGGQGITDIGMESRNQLMKNMKMPVQDQMRETDPWLGQAGMKLDQAYADAEKALTRKFKGYGADQSSEFMKEMTRLQQNKAQEKAALQYEAQEREYVRVQNQKYDSVKTALGVDDTVMKDLLGLTQLSVEEAGLKYGAEAADVASLREALGLTGAAILNIGKPQYSMASSMMGGLI